MIEWQFPSANNTGSHGLKSYQESYKDEPFLSLAKEICQNSLDAAIDDKKSVIVEMKRFIIPRKEFPGYDEYLDVIESCKYYYKKYFHNNESYEFYWNATDIMKGDYITFLRISDFNTTGLDGVDDENNSNWFNLVKSVGQSDKGDGKGGSFGHGKFATFANSQLQTVFYSTFNYQYKKAYQGVARLSTFINENNEKTFGVGYYGNEKCSKCDGLLSMDSEFTRKSHGTDLYIAGFRDDDKDWQYKILASVIDTFFVAIYENRLIFKLGDFSIDSESISEMAENSKITQFLNENTLQYLYAYMNRPGVIVKKGTIIEEDDVLLHICIGSDELRNRVAMIRHNGMKIFDKDRLRRTSFFSGVLEIEKSRLDKLLRSLENPKHDGWNTSRAKNEIQRQDAENIIKKMYSFIQNTINEFVNIDHPTEIDVEGLSEFLPDDIDTEYSSNKHSNSAENEKIKEIIVSKKNIFKEKGKADGNLDASLIVQDDDGELILPSNGTSSNGFIPSQKKDNYIEIGNSRDEVKHILLFYGGLYHFYTKLKIPTKSLILAFKLSGENIASDDFEILNFKNINNKYFIRNDKNKFHISSEFHQNEFSLSFKISKQEALALEVKYYVIKD